MSTNGIRIIQGKISHYPVENNLSGTATWNTEYKLGTINSLSFTIPSYAVTSGTCEIRISFTAGSSGTSFSINTSNFTTAYGFSDIQIFPGNTYEISIMPISVSIVTCLINLICQKEYVALIPTMTSNFTPSGICSATIYRSGYESRAYMAFDGDGSTGADVWYGQAFQLATKTCYEWPSAVSISKVSWQGYVDGAGTLTAGVCEYKNTSNTWVSLFTFNQVNGEQYLDTPVTATGIRLGATTTSNNRGMLFFIIQCYS